MKVTVLLFVSFLLLTGLHGQVKTFTGSTPANNEGVRKFLGMPLTDSVDFIRWKITMENNQYALICNYGIGKPNTSGFMKGGKWVELNGTMKKEKNYFFLQSGDKTLGLLVVNNVLLHLLNEEKTMLIGNGGWSYTLNRVGASPSNEVNLFSKQIALKDSMFFHGRTPCWDFPLVHSSPQCIKKKWLIVLYADVKTNQPTTYHLNGNSRGEGGTRGTWKIKTDKNGRIVYQLFSEKETSPLELLVLDKNILAFIDRQGRLLVGNEDFSYTLSRK